MSGRERVLIVDCQTAGVAGDMILAALLDLGADREKVVRSVEALEGHIPGCRGVKANVAEVVRGGFRAKKVDVQAQDMDEVQGVELVKGLHDCAKGLGLPERALKLSLDSMKTLIEAEARLHGESVEEVHLHEAGSIDTPAEILGTAVALDDLGLLEGARRYSTPVAVGGGTFRFSHGAVSSPAPATIEILRSRGFPMVGGPVESELATPTGAAILVNLADEVIRFYPMVRPISVGYGAGTKEFREMPNILRMVLGEPFDHKLLTDEVYVLKTNIDDATGEVVGHAMERLFEEGAKDVSIIPIYAKKNRPGHMVEVIADKADVERLSMVLIRETGSLGVRTYPSRRYILERKVVAVEVEIGGVKEVVRVKVARDRGGRLIQSKPEYDDISGLARRTGKPIREVELEVRRKMMTEQSLEGQGA